VYAKIDYLGYKTLNLLTTHYLIPLFRMILPYKRYVLDVINDLNIAFLSNVSKHNCKTYRLCSSSLFQLKESCI